MSEIAQTSISEDAGSSHGAASLSQTDSALHESERNSDTDSFHMTRNDTDSHRDSESDQEARTPLLTKKWIQNFFKQEWKMYYRTIELNEKLYFHYKGFESIQCMELFPDLKCLYFEGNGITQIRGLATNTQLMSLMLQENLIKKMEGLSTLANLRTLNLAENVITKIEGLDNCPLLNSLYLKKNRIGLAGNSALEGLLDCPSLECVELANNLIEDPSCVQEIF
jgi:dynein assembly factor 1, axonemal